jgi:N-acetyl-beta-hexosaminidase
MPDHTFAGAAREAGSALGHAELGIGVPAGRAAVEIRRGSGLRPDGYRLAIGPAGIRLDAADPAAAFHGAQTLRQIARQCGPALPCLAISDWPDFAHRGVYYDVCRGRVPRTEQLEAMAGELARYKVNQNLWMARNRRSDINATLSRYRRAIAALA